jgi:hypothetical protein
MKNLHLTRSDKTSATPARAWQAAHAPMDFTTLHPVNSPLAQRLIQAAARHPAPASRSNTLLQR